MELALEPRSGISIFGLGKQQRSPYISTVRRVNAVVEMTEDGRQQAAIFNLPGLVEFIAFGSGPARAMFLLEESLSFFIVTGNQIIKANVNQPPRTLGILTTTEGPVWMDSNGEQIFINDGETALIYNIEDDLLSGVTDSDYPTGAKGGVFLQQRFFVYIPSDHPDVAKRGRVYASAQANGNDWPGLNFFTPESVPDGIVGVARNANDLVVLGHKSIEWWSGAPTTLAGALGFRPIAGANVDVGLVAEQGYAKADQRLFIIGKSDGQTGVYSIEGYTAKKVSPPWVDDELDERPTHSIAICTSYAASGHMIFQVTLPGDSADNALTIIYDSSTDLWSFRESLHKPYYRGLFAAVGAKSVYITDAFEGRICRMSNTVYTEIDEPMPFELTSIHILKEGDMLAISEIWVDMETGLGTPTGQGLQPQGMLQISKDGGHTWKSEKWVNLGATGQYKRRAIRRRIGSARDIAIRFRVTDPVPRRVAGAYLRLIGGES